MAIGTYYSANTGQTGPNVTVASVYGSWIIANDDAETAQSATDLLVPHGIDDATFHWVRVGPGCTRALVRARALVGATVTTDPVVRLIGAFGNINADGSMPSDGTVNFLRLDNVDANAAGLTLDCVTSGSGLLRDATYMYTDPLPSLDGVDLRGANYVGVAVETAANVNTGVVAVQLLLLN